MSRIASAIAATALLVLLAAAPAQAQAPPPELGTWVGKYRDGRIPVKMRLVLRRLQVGARAGRAIYRAPDATCRGRLTLRARSPRGLILRDRLRSGPRSKCTNGDTLIVRSVAPDRLRVKVRNGRSVLRITLRRR